MKRLAMILVAATIVVIGALIVGPRFIPAETARDRIADQIAQWIGREVAFAGEPEITFFPRPTIRLEQVTVAGAEESEGDLIVADELIGTFRYLPLLWGAVELSGFELVNPTISLRVDDDGNSNWIFDGTLGDRITEALRESDVDAAGEPIGEVVLGRFKITGGTITLDRPDAPRTAITDVELELNWPSTAGAATADGSLMWRGERVAVTASLSEPLELIAGRVSPARFELVAQPARIVFDGFVGRDELDFALLGDTDVTMTSLRSVLDWVGTPMAPGTTLGGAAFSGEVGWTWPVLSLADAEIRLDGNVVNGALTIEFGGERTHIVGTIAAGDLDLSPYAYAFRDDVDETGAWRLAPIDLPALTDVDWDLRISATRLIVADTRLEGFAASAIVNAGTVDLRLADAGFYGGRISATLNGELSGPTFALATELTLTDVNVLPAMNDVIGVAPISGRGSLELNAATRGETWGELVERLTGSLHARMTTGSLLGVDFEAAAAASPPTADVALASGQEAAIETLRADFSLSEGQMTAERIDIVGEGFTLSFAGWGSLTTPAIGGYGVAWLDAIEGEAREMPFRVGGSWLAPQFSDDPAALEIVTQPLAAE